MSRYRPRQIYRGSALTRLRQRVAALLLSMSLSTFILSLVATAAFAGVVYVGPSIYRAMTADPVCALPAKTVRFLVIDASDPLASKSQEKARDEFVEEILKNSRAGDRLHISRLTANPKAPLESMYDGCDPGSSADVSMVSVTPADADDQKAAFRAEVRGKVVQAYDIKALSATPLIEALAALFRQQSFFASDAHVSKEVYVLTDGLQNTPGFKMYPDKQPAAPMVRQVPVKPAAVNPLPVRPAPIRTVQKQKPRPTPAVPVMKPSAENEAYANGLKYPVRNAEVTIGYLVRGKSQSDATEAWLRHHIESQGASVHWIPLW